MVQNRNRMVKELARAERTFIILATFSTLPPAKSEKNRPSRRKKGAPGGCPTSSLKEAEINSPQSQKLAVGSIVARYTIEATRKTIHPIMLLIRWYLFIL